MELGDHMAFVSAIELSCKSALCCLICGYLHSIFILVLLLVLPKLCLFAHLNTNVKISFCFTFNLDDNLLSIILIMFFLLLFSG